MDVSSVTASLHPDATARKSPAVARGQWRAHLTGMIRRALLALLVLAAPAAAQDAPVVASERANFRVTTFAQGLENPWGAAFLPDGSLLVTERPGRLRRIGAARDVLQGGQE
jgi:glucose/arabinose dehydrogenase